MNQPNFFSDGSPFLSHPLLTAERTTHEIDFVVAALHLAPPQRVLDVGCGFGRHSIELAARGYAVVGIDPAPDMIAAARSRAAAAGVAVDFRCERGEAFIAAAPFDAAICLFTSLGQITDQDDNRALLPRVYAALRPGGGFLVEVPQREAAVAALKPAERFGGADTYTAVTRRFDPLENTVSEDFELVDAGEARTYHLRYRLYSQTELLDLLQQAGFSNLAAYGDYDGTPLQADHPNMIIRAEKQ